jgi:DNA-binding XRE family transcriptional regulator
MKEKSSYLSDMTSPASTQRQPDPSAVVAKAALAAAERLGLTSRHLAQVVGVSEATVSRLNSGRGIDPASKEGELALMFVRLFRSLDALVGGDDANARHEHASCRSTGHADLHRGGVGRCRPVSGCNARATLAFVRSSVQRGAWSNRNMRSPRANS